MEGWLYYEKIWLRLVYLRLPLGYMYWRIMAHLDIYQRDEEKITYSLAY